MIEDDILGALAWGNYTLKQLHDNLPYSRNYIAMHVRRLVREGKVKLIGMRGKAHLYGSMDEALQPIRPNGFERVRTALERMGTAHRASICKDSDTTMDVTAVSLGLLIKRGLAERIGKGEYRYVG